MTGHQPAQVQAQPYPYPTQVQLRCTRCQHLTGDDYALSAISGDVLCAACATGERGWTDHADAGRATRDDASVDLYELDLRRTDARRTLLIGVVLTGLSGAVLVGWMFVMFLLARTTDSTRSTGLLALAVFLAVYGVRSVAQGLRKRAEARPLEQSFLTRHGRAQPRSR